MLVKVIGAERNPLQRNAFHCIVAFNDTNELVGLNIPKKLFTARMPLNLDFINPFCSSDTNLFSQRRGAKISHPNLHLDKHCVSFRLP